MSSKASTIWSQSIFITLSTLNIFTWGIKQAGDMRSEADTSSENRI